MLEPELKFGGAPCKNRGTLSASRAGLVFGVSGHVMNRILIKCPTTGRMIYRGFAMDPKIFEASPVEENPVECPACGKTHTWTKRDAYLEADK